MATAEAHPQVVAAVALHPNEAPLLAEQGRLDDALAEIERLARSSDRVARGRRDRPRPVPHRTEGTAAQQHSFRAHVELAAASTAPW